MKLKIITLWIIGMFMFSSLAYAAGSGCTCEWKKNIPEAEKIFQKFMKTEACMGAKLICPLPGVFGNDCCNSVYGGEMGIAAILNSGKADSCSLCVPKDSCTPSKTAAEKAWPPAVNKCKTDIETCETDCVTCKKDCISQYDACIAADYTQSSCNSNLQTCNKNCDIKCESCCKTKQNECATNLGKIYDTAVKGENLARTTAVTAANTLNIQGRSSKEIASQCVSPEEAKNWAESEMTPEAWEGGVNDEKVGEAIDPEFRKRHMDDYVKEHGKTPQPFSDEGKLVNAEDIGERLSSGAGSPAGREGIASNVERVKGIVDKYGSFPGASSLDDGTELPAGDYAKGKADYGEVTEIKTEGNKIPKIEGTTTKDLEFNPVTYKPPEPSSLVGNKAAIEDTLIKMDQTRKEVAQIDEWIKEADKPMGYKMRQKTGASGQAARDAYDTALKAKQSRLDLIRGYGDSLRKVDDQYLTDNFKDTSIIWTSAKEKSLDDSYKFVIDNRGSGLKFAKD